MRCSVCNKNTAVIFINKPGTDKDSVEGLCYSCAKKRGINPLEILAKNANISSEDIENLSGQFENILKDFSDNMNLEALGIDNIEDLQNINPEDLNIDNGDSDGDDNKDNTFSGLLRFIKITGIVDVNWSKSD